MSAFDHDIIESVRVIERKAKLAEALGPGYRITIAQGDLVAFATISRLVVAQTSLRQMQKEALRWRWAFCWFVIGAIFMAACLT